jgi:uncharacterized membrane protein YeaQ/YmgE (transglycosylase-associated protein family)
VQNFDEYIMQVVGSLNVSKNKKDEMADEFRDHLMLLKKDLLKNGLSEEEATAEAVRLFGDSTLLKERLAKNVVGYRSISNVIFGIIFVVLLFLAGSRVPVPGINSWDDIKNIRVLMDIMFALNTMLLFIPVGYFTPIIFKRAYRFIHIAIAVLLLSPVRGILLSIDVNKIETEFLVMNILGGLIGALFGFCILKLVSRVSSKISQFKIVKSQAD